MLGNVELFRLLLKCVLLWRALPAFLGPLEQISCCIPSSPSLLHPGYRSSHGEGKLISTRASFWLGWKQQLPAALPPSWLLEPELECRETRDGQQLGMDVSWGLDARGVHVQPVLDVKLMPAQGQVMSRASPGGTAGLRLHQPGFSLFFWQVSRECVKTSIFLQLSVVWWFGFVAPQGG